MLNLDIPVQGLFPIETIKSFILLCHMLEIQGFMLGKVLSMPGCVVSK